MVHSTVLRYSWIVHVYCLWSSCRAYAPLMSRGHWRSARADHRSLSTQQKTVPASFCLSEASSPLSELSYVRRAALFEYMLRDFQVEGVPLLAVDADQVDTLQAAMWTIMAELSEQSSGEKACMIFEDMPIDTLRSFVDHFMALKAQERLIEAVPELGRFNLSLVGKGVGPAILIETGNTAAEASFGEAAPVAAKSVEDEFKCQAAMKSFVARMVVKTDPYPYKESYPMLYKTCTFSEVCHILSSFWNRVCEMAISPDNYSGSIMLTLPNLELSSRDDNNNFGRFGAISELISRSLCWYKGDEMFEVYHFHPTYNRDEIFPKDGWAHGHIPPKGWLKSIIMSQQQGSDGGGGGENNARRDLTNDDMATYDYQRRSPIPAVWIKRVSLLNMADESIEVDLGDGRKHTLSKKIAPTILALGDQGEPRLKEELESELAILR